LWEASWQPVGFFPGIAGDWERVMSDGGDDRKSGSLPAPFIFRISMFVSPRALPVTAIGAPELAAAAVGAVVYGVVSALALLAAIAFGSLVRPFAPALAGAASARALAGGVLFLLVVHGLDRGWTVEPA
jgi:hypothetical protein